MQAPKYDPARPYSAGGRWPERTVKIVASTQHAAGGHKFLIIEEKDFDPAIHALYEEETK